MLLEHTNVIRSLSQDRALRTLRYDYSAARQKISKLVDLLRDAKTPFLFSCVPLFTFRIIKFLLLSPPFFRSTLICHLSAFRNFLLSIVISIIRNTSRFFTSLSFLIIIAIISTAVVVGRILGLPLQPSLFRFYRTSTRKIYGKCMSTT